ncbi:hypothetical protein D9M68_18480 [compost metagenome]
MCIRLGKKHFQYVGTDGLNKLKYEKDKRTGRPLDQMYRVRLLNAHTCLRDVYFNPQNNCSEGINKRLTPAKQKLYDKLDKYFDRTSTGK